MWIIYSFDWKLFCKESSPFHFLHTEYLTYTKQNNMINKGFKAYNAWQVFNCSLRTFIKSKSSSCYLSAVEMPASIMCFPTWNASLSHAIFQLFIRHAFYFAPDVTSSFPSTLWPFHYFHFIAISSLHDNQNVIHQWNKCVAVWPKRSCSVLCTSLNKTKKLLSTFCFCKHF